MERSYHTHEIMENKTNKILSALGFDNKKSSKVHRLIKVSALTVCSVISLPSFAGSWVCVKGLIIDPTGKNPTFESNICEYKSNMFSYQNYYYPYHYDTTDSFDDYYDDYEDEEACPVPKLKALNYSSSSSKCKEKFDYCQIVDKINAALHAIPILGSALNGFSIGAAPAGSGLNTVNAAYYDMKNYFAGDRIPYYGNSNAPIDWFKANIDWYKYDDTWNTNNPGVKPTRLNGGYSSILATYFQSFSLGNGKYNIPSEILPVDIDTNIPCD